MKIFVILFLLLIGNTALSQAYLSGTFSNKSAGFNLIIKDNSNYFGFGASFFRDKGNKGNDYTNFIRPNSDVYEVVNSLDGTIYASYGRKYNNNIINARLGFGTKKWIYNGKTNDLYWYVYRDGGTYLLYGIDYRLVLKKIITGVSLDNFNGIGISAGIVLNNK